MHKRITFYNKSKFINNMSYSKDKPNKRESYEMTVQTLLEESDSDDSNDC